MLLGQLPLLLGAADGPLEPREVVEEELAHLRLELGDAGGLARARDGRRLHLEHRHVVGGAPLLAVDVLEPRGRPDVRRVAVDRVHQIGLGPLGVAQLVDPQLGGQVEQLARLGVVLDGLGAGLVQGHQPVVLLRLAVRLTQRDERLGVRRVALKCGFVFADGGHARGDLFPSDGRNGRRRKSKARTLTWLPARKPSGPKAAQAAESQAFVGVRNRLQFG